MLVVYCNKELFKNVVIYNKMFSYYKNEIINVLKNQWKEEDIVGESKKQIQATNYFLAFLYTLLLKNEEVEGLSTHQYLINKYDIEVIKKCFACKGISLDKLFELSEIELTIQLPCKGINGLQVQGNYGIGQKNCFNKKQNNPIKPTDLKNLLLLDRTKNILIPSNC